MEALLLLLVLVLVLEEGTVNAAWSVTFENPDLCAVKGSSVEFRCSYNYSNTETVRMTGWLKGEMRNGIWKRVALADISSYENRTESLGDLQHNCSLVIHDLRENDTGYYYFWFDTNKYGRSSKTSVYLSVTELRASVSPRYVAVGNNVTLRCEASCQLPTVVWFKDGQTVMKPEFQAQAEDAGDYVCAAKGQESLLSVPVTVDVLYAPLNVSIDVCYSGSLTVGSSVNLTCSSVSHPAASNYTWYRTDALTSTMAEVGSGPVLSIPSMDSSHSGLYICEAENQVGVNNSTVEVLLTEDDRDINTLILLIGFGFKLLLLLLCTPVIIWVWKKTFCAVDNKVRWIQVWVNT
ncbi:uncharacterized protein V6R79_015020 [Siganus canaliculatus]